MYVYILLFCDTMKIYAITSRLSGGCYVGSTNLPLKIRFRIHQSGYRQTVAGTSTHFVSSHKVIKYGDAKIRIIEICDDGDTTEREHYWISRLSNTNQNLPILIPMEEYNRQYRSKKTDCPLCGKRVRFISLRNHINRPICRRLENFVIFNQLPDSF